MSTLYRNDVSSFYLIMYVRVFSYYKEMQELAGTLSCVKRHEGSLFLGSEAIFEFRLRIREAEVWGTY